MANNITLGIQHPEVDRVAYFLNSVEYTLQQIPLDWSSWEMSEAIKYGWCYTSTDPQIPLTITVLLCTSYSKAQQIASIQAAITPSIPWGQNGSIIFSAKSDDIHKVNHVLSIFAGEE